VDWFKSAAKLTPVVVLIFVALAGIGVSTAAGAHPQLTGADAFGLLMFLIPATGVAGIPILISPTTSNVNMLPHMAVAIAIIAFTTAMGYLAIFNNGQILGVYSALLGAGTISLGISLATPNLVGKPELAVAADEAALTEAVDDLPGAVVQPAPAGS
jgi:hypothetical protein